MKLTVGLGSVCDYPDYVKAGADEVFFGYVPMDWQIKYGQGMPLNRREVKYYNVQIGSESEMLILSDMVAKYGVKAVITLNSLGYRENQYGYILDYIMRCKNMGFDTFIIADFYLLKFLKKQGITSLIKVIISGEMAEVNSIFVDEVKKYDAKRIIFHRGNTIPQMQSIINNHSELEYEAFILNEKCHFHGAFCNSLHCDEMPPICRIPYVLEGYEPQNKIENEFFGDSGCGICKLKDLEGAGIDFLKVVGRGNHSEDMVRDIKKLKYFLLKLKDEQYTEIFLDKCNKNCYYF